MTAMEYVFGSTLICEDSDTAKLVTFDPAVRLKSVTLEGDVYDPAGTLSGGSAPQSSGVLVTLQKLNELTKELTEAEKRLAAVEAQIAKEKKNLDATSKIKQELDLKQHEISLAEQQINGNSSSSVSQTQELIPYMLADNVTKDHPSRRGNKSKHYTAKRRYEGG